jgi:hypothetical protein
LLQGGFPEGPNSLRAAEPHQWPCAVGGVVVVCGVGRGHTEVPGPRNRRDESAHPSRRATSPRPSGTRSHGLRFTSAGVAAGSMVSAERSVTSCMIDDASGVLRLGSCPRPGACSPLSGRHLGGWLRGFRLPELSFGEAHGHGWRDQRGITVEILEAVCRGFGRAGRPSGIRRETVTFRRLRVLVALGPSNSVRFFR